MQKLVISFPNNPVFLGIYSPNIFTIWFCSKIFQFEKQVKKFCKEFYEIIFHPPNAPIIHPYDLVNPTWYIDKHTRTHRLLTRCLDWPLPDTHTRTHRLLSRWLDWPRPGKHTRTHRLLSRWLDWPYPTRIPVLIGYWPDDSIDPTRYTDDPQNLKEFWKEFYRFYQHIKFA